MRRVLSRPPVPIPSPRGVTSCAAGSVPAGAGSVPFSVGRSCFWGQMPQKHHLGTMGSPEIPRSPLPSCLGSSPHSQLLAGDVHWKLIDLLVCPTLGCLWDISCIGAWCWALLLGVSVGFWGEWGLRDMGVAAVPNTTSPHVLCPHTVSQSCTTASPEPWQQKETAAIAASDSSSRPFPSGESTEGTRGRNVPGAAAAPAVHAAFTAYGLREPRPNSQGPPDGWRTLYFLSRPFIKVSKAGVFPAPCASR